MGFQRFDIELDNNVGVFFPGQVVSGKICILNNSSVKTFKSLHLECKGMAKVRFSVRQGKRTRVRQSSIQYFDYKRSLTEGIFLASTMVKSLKLIQHKNIMVEYLESHCCCTDSGYIDD